jgi:tetratricopeptide (TPR) repeat protein
MSKKKPIKKKTKSKSEAKPREVAPNAAMDKSVSYPAAPVSTNDGLLKKVFWYAAGVMFLLTVFLSFNSGINGDDEYQNDYSKKLVAYYSTMGADTSALYIEKGNMHYYGGFFDLLTGAVNSAFGFDEFDTAYHQLRHFFNALFGLLAMVFVGLLVRELAGWRAAILALAFMFLSPRFLGHALMNPKDIPFAAGFAVALYYMVRLIRTIERPRWQTALGLALGIALALATRAGGLLLFAYLGLFAGLDFLFKYGIKGLTTHTRVFVNYLIYGLGAAIVGYILAILTWPAALVDPIGHPLAALTEFSKLGVKIRLLFMGGNVMSDDTAWYYAPLWIAKTIPLFALAGFLGSFVFFFSWMKKYGRTETLLLFFAAIFPIAYVIYKDSILHDGWRHLMFVYPSMLVLAALFWVELEKRWGKRKQIRWAIWGVLALLVLESTVFIARNYSYPYVYFNAIGGGLAGAFGDYETDYWGTSVKQAINWLDEEGIISPDMPDTIVLGTTFYYNLSRQTRRQYNGKVRLEYVRFNNRYDKDWKYGIFPSRYIRSEHLKSGSWPNSKSVHTVTASGVPLLSIEKNETRDAYLGQQAVKKRQWREALQYFQKELERHADNELAWVGMANAYLNTGQFQQAVEAADNALTIAPDLEAGLLYKGMAYLNQNKGQEALLAFDEATRINDEYYAAYYYKAIIFEQRQELQQALDAVQKAIESNPSFKGSYELAARIFEKAGDQENAARYRRAAQQ